MKQYLTRTGVVGAILAVLLLAAGCNDDGPAEQAGEQVDEAAEEAGDTVENAADEAEDAAD